MKFMNMKRFGSIVMAGALALSLTAPALAGSSTTPAGQVTISGSYKDIPISVEVPTTGEAQLNPYGLPIEIQNGESTVNLVGQKITSKPMNIKNQGETSLDVNASLLVIPKGDVEIAAAKDTGKKIAVNLEVAGLNNASYAVAPDNERLESLLITAFANPETWSNATTLAAPAVAKAATTGTPAKSAQAMATLGAVTKRSDSYMYGADSIALFRLTGDVAQAPVKAATGGGTEDDPWKSTDGFTATIVFSFVPTPPSPGDASVTLAISGTTATATFVPGTSNLTVASYAWTATKTAGQSFKNASVTANSDPKTATIADETGTSSGDKTDITVTLTLSNGSTVTATQVYTKA